MDTEAIAVAHHESAHAFATLHAFRNAQWLPHPPPSPLISTVEIIEHAPGHWCGHCINANIYSPKWPDECIAPRYRDLMQRQAVIHLSGGIAEALVRGEQRREEVLAFARANCAMQTDWEGACAVLADLWRLTGVRHDEQSFALRARWLLLQNWSAVTALAAVLVEDRRIEGDRVEAIIDRASW